MSIQLAQVWRAIGAELAQRVPAKGAGCANSALKGRLNWRTTSQPLELGAAQSWNWRGIGAIWRTAP